MRILIVGAGSTGGFFGARLIQAGRDVTFLVRPGRAAQLHADGLHVFSPHGDFSVTPRLTTASELSEPFDLVLLTVKAYTLEQALEDIAPAVGPATTILPVLNGIRHLDLIIQRFGPQVLVGGLCKIISTLDEHGRIVQGAAINELTYGELDGSVGARIERVHATLDNAGFTARVSTTIERELWEKWVLLAALGGINSLMRGTIGEVASAPGGLAFSHTMIDEIVAVARAVGVPPGEAYLADIRRALTLKDSLQTSSMYRDLLAGHPIECDQIIGDLLSRAHHSHLSTPLLAAVYANLSVYQQQRL